MLNTTTLNICLHIRCNRQTEKIRIQKGFIYLLNSHQNIARRVNVVSVGYTSKYFFIISSYIRLTSKKINKINENLFIMSTPNFVYLNLDLE